ncbi:MAG TPA: alanine racemase [Dermatophilaceae bacterium]|nr:alanine racemase [Dermatophilaceae bacterium]
MRQTPSAWPAVASPIAVPAWITIDLDAITANVAVLRDAAGSAGLMAVVKADGYGHGLVPSARAALRGGADWLATAQLDEALQLRRAGISAPVLSWLHVPGADFATAIEAGIDLGVSARWAVVQVAEAARATGRPARIHLKVDTGLARNGCTPVDLPDLLPAIGRLVAEGAVELVGVFSHFAYADAPEHPTVAAQERRFADVLAMLDRAGLRPGLRHLANSAATLTNPRAAYDLVRPGLAVYGLSPVPDRSTSAALGLRPAMTVSARLALAKDVLAGQGVSYGHEYVTSRDTRVVLVPIGYADGLPRAAGNRAPIVVAGRRFTIAGRVCMDQVVLDVGPDHAAQAGDLAVLFGPGDDGEPTAQEWAEATGTISYEIVTRMSARLPRSFAGEA